MWPLNTGATWNFQIPVILRVAFLSVAFNASTKAGACAGVRYHFHFLSHGERYEDRLGEEFASVEEAIAHANRLATQLGLGAVDSEQSLIVADAKGNEIAVISVARPPIGPQDT
jgi:uncharacterized protein DUF6894